MLTYSDTTLFDIIVADNGSTDGSLEKLQTQFPELIFLDNKENLGFAEGNNKAIQFSITNAYTYSLIINNDTEIEDDLISGLLRHLEQHPEAAAVQPRINWLHHKTAIWNGAGGYNAITGRVYTDKKVSGRSGSFRKAKWLTGCCMLVRNDVLSATGAFNSRFFLYYEDTELSFRIRAAGHELHYLPQLKLYHDAGASGQLSTKEKEGTLNPFIHYYVTRNHIWFLRKFGNPLFYPVMFLVYLPYYTGILGYFVFRNRKKKAEYLIKGIKDGFFTPEKVIWPELKKDSTA